MRRLALLCIAVLVGTLGAARLASPGQAQGDQGEIYTVQSGDWLSKIAEKYYGDASKYPTIIEATNARAADDDSFTAIADANLIHVGQQLWIPAVLEAGTIVADDIPFQPVEIEELGIRTLVPRNWPRVESNDPFLAHAWRAGPVSFVSFTTTPGNDALVGLARLLGVNREDLAGGPIAGQLTEVQVGDRTWTVYWREEAGRTSGQGATVQDKVVYQVSLSAETSQLSTIFTTMLESFEIVDPTASQQLINLVSPMPGRTLTNPFELRGNTTQYPFKGRLIYRVLDAEGNQVGRAPFEVVGRLGNPSTFAVQANYNVPMEGPGTVEVAEVSGADGAIITIDSVGVTLAADPKGYTVIIDDPKPYADVSSPVQVRGKTLDKPYAGTLHYRIVDATGQEISNGLFLASGQSGQINSFDAFVEFSVSENGPGRIEVYDINPADNSVFAIGTVNVWLTTTP